MNIKPVASPHAISPAQPSTSQQDARARAIARLSEQPVPNATQVSPEEMSAISPTSGHSDTEETSEHQVDTRTDEVKTPSPKEDPTVSAQFAKLARQTKALRQEKMRQEEIFKQRDAQLQAREAELSSKSQQLDPSRYIERSQFKQNPLQVLAEVGISYDEITQAILNQPQVDPRTLAQIKALEDKLAKMEEAAQRGQQSQQEAQQQQYQQAVKQIENETRMLIKQDPTTFELIRATNSVKDVVELIEATFNKDGILLSVEEAAQQVEEYLLEEAEKLTRVDKIKKRLASNASPSKPAAQAQQVLAKPQQKQPMKTLTNATASGKQLSARERAIAAMEGRLK